MNEFERLAEMGAWEHRFAKDAAHNGKRLARLVKLTRKGYVCPAYAEEAAAIAKELRRDGERVAKWLKALYEAQATVEAKGRRCKKCSSSGTPS